MQPITAERETRELELVRRDGARGILPAIALGALWFALCRHLSSEWSINEQYSYGWFVPFFAAYLFWLRWEKRPAPEPPRRSLLAFAAGLAALALLLPLRTFEIGNPDWRPLGWLHAGAVVALTLLALREAGGRRWVRHFLFPVLFFLVAVPWVTPIEGPIVQGLMRLVAAIAAEILTLLGVPAQLEGSLIRVSTGLVGVSEACSGVRSLQTSLMIGLLFGELKMFSAPRRLALIAGAVALALLANIVRALVLVWIAAQHGVSAVGRWHDMAGYSIVAVVFVGTLGLATLLHGKSAAAPNENAGTAKKSRCFPRLVPMAILAWLVAVELVAFGWYRWHERHLTPRAQWTVRWPETAPGFRDVPIDESVRRTLRFDHGREVVWHSRDDFLPAGASLEPKTFSETTPLSCLLYFFRWEAGSSSVLRARAHRPDICLPSAGWRQTADDGVRSYAGPGGLRLPFRHFEFSHSLGGAGREQLAHAFFCLREDWIPAGEEYESHDTAQASATPGDWTLGDRWRVVLAGRRDLGQQVMEVVAVSGRPIAARTAEARFADLIRGVIIPKDR